ncbi:hydroxymethylbilane synthase [Niveispirillum sp. BGYR6]|uniref:hydroxymethylbilane synthase n=1 Tax=Niveispirillum sp. BGYR6 TaxID=2971249 RepID=UPI0022B99863|nr:hydroxymethylbilane synthase [Niveispirillum sp. BGYR6]MDG5497863.1 hydroxymethylbilane synthase [Niveispirillum sp. BGYR6]
MTALLRIGTRGSPLALAQAHETRDRLAARFPELASPDAIEIVTFKTEGDRIQDRTLMAAGGKGLFTKEIEEALLDGRVDLAVHSMKDVPTWLPDGLAITALLPREDHRDGWISPKAATLDDLPAGALVGTASLRRQALVLMRRPDLRVIAFRGNVQTRLRKLEEGHVDATLLAMAGVRRLGLADRITSVLEPDVMLPAVAQGAIGIETRISDDRTNAYVTALNCAETASRVAAERGVLATLDGSCRTPIAALALISGTALTVKALVIRPDGRQWFTTARSGAVADALAMGVDAGNELKAMLPSDFFQAPNAVADGPVV